MRVRTIMSAFTLAAALPFAAPAPEARADADGCAAGVRSDFNGDGNSDAVVADPTATIGGLAGAGRVVVHYGDVDGDVGEGAREALYEGAFSVLGTPAAGDHFGSALAALDADCDGFTDLAVGVPGQDQFGQADSGRVYLIWGSGDGLGHGADSTILLQSTFSRPAVTGDRFGAALAGLEDVGQGGTPAPDAFVLAIGVPGAAVDGVDDAGAVAVLAPLDGGPGRHWITQNTPGIPGAAEAGDGFGAAVTCNHLAGGPEVDCVVGVPGEDIGSAVDAGGATLLTDVYYEDEYTGVAIDQNADGVPGVAEAGDRYGAVVDSIRVGGTARLAVGAPGEDVGSANGAGSVQLFGSDTETLDPGTGLSQNTSGVGGTAEAGDAFGSSLAWLAPGLGDPRTRLAVGVPREDTTAGVDAGMVQVFPTQALGSELSWTQNSPGVPGVAAAGDRFGSAVSVVAGVSERVLLVGVPDDTANSTGMVDVIVFGADTHRAWVPGGAIPTAGADRYGAVLAGVDGGAE